MLKKSVEKAEKTLISGKAKSRLKWLRYGVAVAGIHLLGITLFLMNFKQHPQLLGISFVAYTLGLRHAFDADHIAAVDNTVRKMIQQKQNPMGVGFFFSIGHSTVVCIMAIITAFSMRWAQQNLPQIQNVAGMIGTAVAGSFLLLIGLFNLYVWFDIYDFFLKMRRGEIAEENLDQLLLNRGFVSRFFKPLYKFINKSWHVYPLGFLFGLSFDTASEVALLAISATLGANGMPFTAVLSLPIIFAAGMSMMDSGWDFYDHCLPVGILYTAKKGLLQFVGYRYLGGCCVSYRLNRTGPGSYAKAWTQ